MSAPDLNLLEDDKKYGRGLGRPSDEERKRRPPVIKWQPKKWKADYDRMVAYSVMGWTNKKIAEKLGCTAQTVSNILGTDQGLNLRKSLEAQLRNQIEKNIPDVLSDAATLAAKRVHDILKDDELAKNSKTAFMVAGLAMDVLKGMKHMTGGGNGSTTVNAERAIVIQGGATDMIAEAMKKSDQAREINANYTITSGDRKEREG